MIETAVDAVHQGIDFVGSNSITAKLRTLTEVAHVHLHALRHLILYDFLGLSLLLLLLRVGLAMRRVNLVDSCQRLSKPQEADAFLHNSGDLAHPPSAALCTAQAVLLSQADRGSGCDCTSVDMTCAPCPRPPAAPWPSSAA